MFNNYEIKNGNNEFTIITDIGSLTLMAQNPNSISYTALGGDYVYYVKYLGTMKRKIQVTSGYGMWYCGINTLTTYVPPYIDSPGNSIAVIVTLPKYFQYRIDYLTGKPAFFLALNPINYQDMLGYDKSSPFNYRNIYADFLFMTKTASAVIYDRYYGRIATNLQFFTQNVNTKNICVKVNKYEYKIGGQWVDHTYYGGVPDYKVGGTSNDVYGMRCGMGGTVNFSLGYPGYSATGSTNGRLTLDFIDRTDNSLMLQAIIESNY